MLLPASAWLVLLIMLGNKLHTLTKCIVNAKHDADQLLNYIDKNQARALKAIIDFVKSI